MNLADLAGVGLPPLTWHTALGTWRFQPVVDVLVLLAAVGYLHRAYRVLPRRGQHWPAGRTAYFLAALLVFALTLQSSIDPYGFTLFWVHMIEHLLLIMVVPALVILGQPIRLLTAGDDRLAAGADTALRSRVVSVLTFPGIGLAAYLVALVATHLTGFIQDMLLNPWLHGVEIAVYLVAGYLYFLPILGHEPLHRVMNYPLRVFLLLMGMSADTIVGIILMMESGEPFPAYADQHRTWGTGLVADIHAGGGIMWVVGDTLMFVIAVLLIAQWMGDTEHRDDTGRWLEAARRASIAHHLGAEETANTYGDTEGAGADIGSDADTDIDRDIDNDDAALAAYNRMLAKLSERDQTRDRERDRQDR